MALSQPGVPGRTLAARERPTGFTQSVRDVLPWLLPRRLAVAVEPKQPLDDELRLSGGVLRAGLRAQDCAELLDVCGAQGRRGAVLVHMDAVSW